jgi:hypothetical protein
MTRRPACTCTPWRLATGALLLTWCGLVHPGSQAAGGGPIEGPRGQGVEEWRIGVLGNDLGRQGIFLADLDGDGTPEIIGSGDGAVGGWVSYWWVLSWDPAVAGYETRWVSDPVPVTITTVATEPAPR